MPGFNEIPLVDIYFVYCASKITPLFDIIKIRRTVPASLRLESFLSAN